MAGPDSTIGPQRCKDIFDPCQRSSLSGWREGNHGSGVESSHRRWESSGLSFLATTRLSCCRMGTKRLVAEAQGG